MRTGNAQVDGDREMEVQTVNEQSSDRPFFEIMQDTVLSPDQRVGDMDQWNRWLAMEADRFGRYGRVCTIVSMELYAVDELARWFGEEIAQQAIDGLVMAALRSTRESDLLALTGRGRVGLILPETDEIQAIHAIDRIDREFESWLETWPVSRSVLLSDGALDRAAGWASTGDDTGFADALAAVEDRRSVARQRIEATVAAIPEA
jgi:hypothetical protein